MHMSDALVSIPTAIGFWSFSGVSLIYAISKVKKEFDEDKEIPFMGVMGAFVFALQMVNFAIPGTGSSGHFAGGFLLSLLLGSNSAFIVMSTVLIVQALFFGDGGLLALGCNIFNLGFIPSFVVYPLFKNLISRNRFYIWLGGWLSLIIGASMVAIQTFISGIAELPFSSMLSLMVGIHLLIGVIEGLITVGVYEMISKYQFYKIKKERGTKPYLSFLIITLIISAVLSILASSKPDGLEWSIYKILGMEKEPESSVSVYHHIVKNFQEKISILPGYNFKNGESLLGTSISGILGSIIVLVFASIIGYTIKKLYERKSS